MAQPQTVVIVIDHAHITGGQVKVALESALGLKARGLDVRIFANVGPADSRLEAAGIPVTLAGGHDIVNDPNRVRAIVNGVWNGGVASALKEMLAALNPETTLVHIHGWAKALSGSIAPVIRDSGMAHVYTMHEYTLACPNSAFLDHSTNTICTRKPLGMSCLTTNCDSRSYFHKGWRVMRQVGLIAGGWPRKLTNVIYISETQLQAMKPYLADECRLWSVANPIEADAGPRVDAEDNDAFVFIGRLSPEKGGALFAEAAKRAGVKAVFVGAGEAEDEIRTANPDAEMIGWTDSAGIAAQMARARALIFPSLWYEGQPLVPFEALAKGLPVVASDACAAHEAITHDETGLLFPIGSVDALTEALVRLKEDGLVGRLSQKAYDRYWQDPLTLDRHLDRLEEVYAGIARA